MNEHRILKVKPPALKKKKTRLKMRQKERKYNIY